MKNKSNAWSNHEIATLENNYATKGAAWCAEILKGRTIEAVRIKAQRLGLIRDKPARYNQIETPKGYSHCPSCNQLLPHSSFYESYRNRPGLPCIECAREKARRSSRKHASSQRERRRDNPEKFLFKNLKTRARSKGIPFSITQEDIKIPDRCPVLGIPIIPNSASDNSPSVDKFIPSLGYVKGNVNVISSRANRIKSDATVDEVEKVLTWMKAKE